MFPSISSVSAPEAQILTKPVRDSQAQALEAPFEASEAPEGLSEKQTQTSAAQDTSQDAQETAFYTDDKLSPSVLASMLEFIEALALSTRAPTALPVEEQEEAALTPKDAQEEADLANEAADEDETGSSKMAQFGSIDENADGSLDISEFFAGRPDDMSEELAGDVFVSMDTDHNGLLSRAEVQDGPGTLASMAAKEAAQEAAQTASTEPSVAPDGTEKPQAALAPAALDEGNAALSSLAAANVSTAGLSMDLLSVLGSEEPLMEEGTSSTGAA